MFIPRHPVVENQFCSYAETSTTTGVGAVIAYAGSVVNLVTAATNQEAVVTKMVSGASEAPFGLLMQKVKTDYHQVHPTGFSMPGDLGSSDVIAQPKYSAGTINGTKEAPVGVAHLGIWDTVHYVPESTAGDVDGNLTPGSSLYPASYEAKLTDNSTTAADATQQTGANAQNTIVARVVKGVSEAKGQANIDNTTLYPIRVKLLI